MRAVGEGQTIEFAATVNKVQTMVDGGLRVVLDFSEKDVMQAAQLMECKRFESVLLVKFTPLLNSEESGNASMGKRSIWKSTRQTAEGTPVDRTA